jgi:hypothetical protein
MKAVRVVLTLLSILLVMGTIVVFASKTDLFVTIHTERFTTTTTATVTITTIINDTTTTSVYENVQVIGNCTAVSYFLPDTVEQLVTDVTITSGNTTTHSISFGSTIRATTTTLGTRIYTVTSYANNTSIFTVTSESDDLSDIPSDGWTNTICTYQP